MRILSFVLRNRSLAKACALKPNAQHPTRLATAAASTAEDTFETPQPKFEDPKAAYASHSNKDLWRAYFVFQMCSYDVLANNQLKVSCSVSSLIKQTSKQQ